MAFAKPKASSTARGYGQQHREARARWLAELNRLGSLPCTRCPRPVLPGQAVHLDHTDDRGSYIGLAHARCNVRAGARRGRQLQQATRLRW